jgi:hypothetical protein
MRARLIRALDVLVEVVIMQWSKLKTRVKDFICPELKDVIDFHVTQYRKAHSWISESWITVNGEKIFDCGSRTYARESAYELFRREESSSDIDGEEVWNLGEALKRREIHEPQHMGEAMRAYLDLPVGDALKSDNPFIKALAIVDRRVGKRTLVQLEIGNSEHSLVKAFYELRRACAHI